MEPLDAQVFQTELEKQVEITILQRRIEIIEKKKKRFFSWKAFAIVGLIGCLFGAFAFYLDSNTYYNSPNYEIINYLDNAHHPAPIIADYKLSNEIRGPYEFSYPDTSGLSSYSPKMVDSVKTIIGNRIKEIESDLKSKRAEKIFLTVGMGALILNAYYFTFILILVFVWKSRVNSIKLKLNAIGAKELKQNLNSEGEKDFFTQLVKINFKYLDQYYLQTQEQADKSFWISAIASIVGFLMIIAGVILMYNSTKNDPGYVATSAGVISEFIAAVFFYLYNRTILKMSQYHQKLVLTQNISLALKTADLLKDSKEKVLESLIDRLTTDINKHLTNNNE